MPTYTYTYKFNIKKSDVQKLAEITWLGHACFRVRGREAVVLMDPCGPHSGSRAPIRADIVTISHDHAGHNALDAVEPGFRAITGPGEYEIRDVFITGIRTYHDAEGGRTLGRNTVYLVELEDLVICHLGDLGHTLTEEQVEGMNAVDVLIVPVGGGVTIDAAGAAEVIGQIEPSIVIPMQFPSNGVDTDREPLERFLTKLGMSDIQPVDRLTVRKSDLGEAVQVVVLRS